MRELMGLQYESKCQLCGRKVYLPCPPERQPYGVILCNWCYSTFWRKHTVVDGKVKEVEL